MRLLWNQKNGSVSGEAGMFIGDEPVKLLFPAKKILRVGCPARQTVYREGEDFFHESGSDLIFRGKNRAVPALSPEALYPKREAAVPFPNPGANAVGRGPDGKLLLFDNQDFFARHQVEIDYEAADNAVFPSFHADRTSLPRFRALLAAGKNCSVTLIGDSISEGFNASEFVKCPPFSPPYISLFASELESRFRGRITVFNAAVEGSGCRHALSIRDRWIGKPCDLLVIAYGMNDFSSVSAGDFRKELEKIISEKQKISPETEYLLVIPMTGNPEWEPTRPGPDLLFAESIGMLSAENVAVADVRSVWLKILERKKFFDLTGNGVNHPNDYGHRIYASVLLNLFL